MVQRLDFGVQFRLKSFSLSLCLGLIKNLLTRLSSIESQPKKVVVEVVVVVFVVVGVGVGVIILGKRNLT